MKTLTKSLGDMMTEVQAFCEAKGWNDQEVSFGEACALLHSEVSEALEAWREWGLRDTTLLHQAASERARNVLPKPEGVGSEFADVLIRWLDDCGRFGIDPEVAFLAHGGGLYGISLSFGDNINALHNLISRASTWRDAGEGPFDQLLAFGGIFVFLRQLCEEYDIDLGAEYERKMAYNRTRSYRHGGKKL